MKKTNSKLKRKPSQNHNKNRNLILNNHLNIISNDFGIKLIHLKIII